MNREELDGFMESIPAKRTRKRLVHGVGVNDSKHITSIRINGVEFKHRAYDTWVGIMRRCYSPLLHTKRPTYRKCEVSEDWRSFSSFQRWWNENHVEGWAIDKDLINPLSNEYSDKNCIYIPIELNSFTTAHDGKRGDYPIGVSMHRGTGKFRAIISGCKGKSISLGLYFDKFSAHKAWYKKKVELAYDYKEICDSIHPDLFSGLLCKIESMKEF